MFNNLALLNEREIPAEFLTRSRAYFLRNMNHLEKVHGGNWESHREWFADYLNQDVMDLIKNVDKRTTHSLDS